MQPGYTAVSNAALAVHIARGEAAARRLLAAFGCERVGQLKQSQWADFVACARIDCATKGDDMDKFRIGGVYRDGDGDVYRFTANCHSPGAYYVESFTRGAWDGRSGAHFLETGKCVGFGDESTYHLLPGELVQVNGEWVAAEKVRLETVTKHEWTVLCVGAPNAPVVTEPARLPLAYYGQRSKFDAFAGYETSRGRNVEDLIPLAHAAGFRGVVCDGPAQFKAPSAI